MTRYTAKRLAERIETINGWLEKDGSLIRFECGGRNGYSAVDEYSVDADGNRIGTGCNRNVGCGTPRECAEYAETAYSNEYRNGVEKRCAAAYQAGRDDEIEAQASNSDPSY